MLVLLGPGKFEHLRDHGEVATIASITPVLRVGVFFGALGMKLMKFCRASRSRALAAYVVMLLPVANLTITPVYAQANNSKARAEVAPKVPKGATPISGMSPGLTVTQAFTQRGVSKCAERIGQFSQFLTNGAQVGGQVFVAPDEPDRRIASASLEIQAGPAIAYAGLEFAPDSGANHCGGIYELVSYWPNTCEDVATKAFATFKRMSPLRESIIALDGGTSVRVFLMSAGTGCVSIKKEITF